MSLADYARFLVDQIKGDHGGGALLTTATYRRLHSDQGRPYYGLGWGVRHLPSWGTVITHTGSNGRWYHVAWASIDRETAIAIAANAPNTTATETAFDQVLNGTLQMLRIRMPLECR